MDAAAAAAEAMAASMATATATTFCQISNFTPGLNEAFVSSCFYKVTCLVSFGSLVKFFGVFPLQLL